MDDDAIRELLTAHAHKGADGTCRVERRALDPALDMQPIREWVLRQEGGRIDPVPGIQGGGLRPNKRVHRADQSMPPSERFVFPCSALDDDRD